MKLNECNDTLNIKELCSVLNIGRNTAYSLLQKQIIPNRKIGKKYFIPKSGVKEFLNIGEQKLESCVNL